VDVNHRGGWTQIFSVKVTEDFSTGRKTQILPSPPAFGWTEGLMDGMTN